MKTRTPEEFGRLLDELRQFMESRVIPAEDWHNASAHDAHSPVVRDLQQQAGRRGLGSPIAAQELGGMALSWEESCEVLELAGRSYLGPVVLRCAPPGQPDIYALQKLASSGQRDRYVRRLQSGEIASCFAMTEPPPGAGSDPSMMLTTATKSEDGWVLNGRKWFITGAGKADVAIVVARTDQGVSWFLVDTRTPGFQIVRDISTLEPFDMGGHGEILLTDCMLPHDALIGEVGRGLEYAQLRLEGARLFHCMRYIGLASRAIDFARDYALQRQSGGQPLAQHQLVQSLVADAHIKLYAARLMTRDVACRLDRGESIRHHSSMAKVFVSEAVFEVADAAVQLCGALGVSDDAPVSMIFRMLRPFRIYDGASEVHRSAIARRVFNRKFSA